MVQRGWATKDPAFEICAHGECKLADARAAREPRSALSATNTRGETEPLAIDAEPEASLAA